MPVAPNRLDCGILVQNGGGFRGVWGAKWCPEDGGSSSDPVIPGEDGPALLS